MSDIESETQIEALDGPDADGAKPTLARAMLAIIVAMLLVGAVAAVISRPSKTSPEKELASVRAYVSQAQTAHFVTESASVTGNDQGPGSSSSDRSTTEGDLRLPDDAHVFENYGDGVSETVAVKGAVYSRDADTRAALATKGWVYNAFVPSSGGIAGAASSAASGLQPDVSAALGSAGAAFAQVMATGGDAGLPEVLGALRDPVRVETHVVRATLDVDALMQSLGLTADQQRQLTQMAGDVTSTVTVTITSGPKGRLDRMVWKAIETASDPADSGTSTEDTRFSNWDAPVTITAPSKDSLDLTPDVDEQGVAAVHDIGLLAPTTLPAGFKLTYAEVIPTDDSDNEQCRSVNITFNDPAADVPPADPTKFDSYSPPPSIDIYEMVPGCAYAPKLEGQSYVAGPNRGFVVPTDQASWGNGPPMPGGPAETDIVMQVGNTLLEVASTVGADQLKAALASLAPLDMATIPIDRMAPPA
ncbi:MAG: hypothetical protein QOG03_1081 [Actinomycetota bacterium]|nr:hypothetical protein [Actinomycetota bacterium]